MDPETLRLFDAYVKDQLDETARAGFDSRLSADDEFKKEFGEFLSLIDGISAYERERLKALISKPGSVLQGRRRWVRLAAAVIGILLLLIPAYIIYRSTTFTERIVEEFYIRDPGLPLVMGISGNPELESAMVEYKDANYKACLGILQTLLQDQEDNDTLNYYAGVCCYELKDTDNSLLYFEKITGADSPYYYHSLYNMALIHITKDDFEVAEKNLEMVISGDEPGLREKGEQLLNRIK